MNEEHDGLQWPPPPNFGPADDTLMSETEVPVRLLTGSALGDTAFGVTLSLISFTLLIFALINPLATTLLPLPARFPIGLRLLTGWFFASVAQYAAWIFFLAHDFQVIRSNIVLTALPVAGIWLSISLLEWMFG